LEVKKWLKWIVVTVVIAIFLFSLVKVLMYYQDGRMARQLNEDMKQIVDSETVYTFVQDEYGNQKIQATLEQAEDIYNALQKVNEDMIGWISIADTEVDYPVMQAKDNAYYLNRSIEKEYSARGSIFMDCQNVEDDSHIVLYGHNMLDGGMFGDMELYVEEEYFKEHPIIEFDMYGKRMRWEIFSIHFGDDRPYQVKFSNDRNFQKYIDEMITSAIYDTGIDATKEDIVLSLSTCASRSSDERFVVHAKLITE
jgi:sortase B